MTDSVSSDDLKALVGGYKPSADTIRLVQSTPVVLLVGISGAGKDTIKHRLLAGGQYHHIVSHTTRPLRENLGVMEQDGVDYHFISKDVAVEMIKEGKFVEAKEYSGNIYGTSAAEIRAAQQQHKIALTDVEVQGVAEYKAISDNVIAIFVLPPSYEEWKRRLLKRYGENGAANSDIAKRMETAVVELREALDRDYYHFVINDEIDRAVHAADRIAHKHDKFNVIDTSFRVWAERLMDDLVAHKGA